MDTEHRRRSPLRILAPVALIATGVALVLIIQSFGNSRNTESASQKSSAAEKARDLGTTPEERRAERRRARREKAKLPDSVYIVKEGDTLGGIADKTGVPVEKLQELNPGLDQFQLSTGQKVKLK
jgi:LysM repeat protein